MKIRITIGLLVITTSLASAQPEPPVPPAPDEPVAPTTDPAPTTEPAPARESPPPAPVEPTPPPTPAAAPTPAAPPAPTPGPVSVVEAEDPYGACLALRRSIGTRIDATRERGRLLLSMPDCERFTPKAVETSDSSTTAEISAGLGMFSVAGSSITRLGGLDVGVGGFVTPRLALTARLAGGTLVDDSGFAYVGTLGPNLQYWSTDHVWFGGGLGIGFALAAGSGQAAGAVGSGMDLRAGYSLGKRGNSMNISIEATSFSSGTSFAAPFSDNALTVMSFLVGYQSAPTPAPTPITAARPVDPDELLELAIEAGDVGGCDTVRRIEKELREVRTPAHVQTLHDQPATARCLP